MQAAVVDRKLDLLARCDRAPRIHDRREHRAILRKELPLVSFVRGSAHGLRRDARCVESEDDVSRCGSAFAFWPGSRGFCALYALSAIPSSAIRLKTQSAKGISRGAQKIIRNSSRVGTCPTPSGVSKSCWA